MTRSALYVGAVTHQRTRPRRHRLRYRLYSLLLDLDEIDALAARLRLFSRRKFNLFAFHDGDHLDGSAEPLRAQVARRLALAGIAAPLGTIRVLAMPRVLGFVFNPLSLWFCHGADGRLVALIYEVNNTFGERHCYVLEVAAGAGATIDHSCDKAFHVSPFAPMALGYRFRVALPGDKLAVAISARDGKGTLIGAAHVARRRALNDRALARVFVTHPLLTAKVVAAIGWEALRLWAKRVPVHPHPAPGPSLSGPSVPRA